MGSSDPELRLPKIDFSGLSPANPGTEEWIAVRAQVVPALEAYGCFEAVYHKVRAEQWEAVFGKGMKEVFGLPLEAKLKNTSEKPYHGYVGQIPGMDYESLIVHGATDREGVEKFAHLMWGPGGNPAFCEAVCSFSKQVSELEQMFRRMVLEIYGIGKYYDSHMESTWYSIRLSEYGAPKTQDPNLALPSHTDMNMVSIVCQHGVDGLEILTKDGRWIAPSANSFTLMIGEAFGAWSNGRFEPPYHRVLMARNAVRYSAIFSSSPKDGYMVQAPEELVDDEHPLQFKPYDYGDYLRLCFSEAGQKSKCALRAYCGVGSNEVEA